MQIIIGECNKMAELELGIKIESDGRDCTPSAIVERLDRYVVGHECAKKAVAVALRNRWRRAQLSEELKGEIHPKNILMIGPTGVGKTEIARRLAELLDVPFLKVEVTKFTEVGYVGRDVESIIRDLVERAIKHCRDRKLASVQDSAREVAIERILDLLLPAPILNSTNNKTSEIGGGGSTRELFRQKILSGELDEKMVEINVAQHDTQQIEVMTPSGMEDMAQQLRSVISNLSSNKSKKRKVCIKQALQLLQSEEAFSTLDEEEIRVEAIRQVEQHSIVFLDEIDKIAQREGVGRSSGDVSREGVQRDLLPLVEGTTVSTRYGLVHTDHILFIASGAFHLCSPSDLMPELQGRFPIRVELEALQVRDFVRILTDTHFSLLAQYQAMLAVDKIDLQFTTDGIQRIAEIAFAVNERTENIGARRLNTILERVLQDVAFASSPGLVVIDAKFVDQRMQGLDTAEDRSRYIL